MTKVYIDQYGQAYSANTLKELKTKVTPWLTSPKTSIMYNDKKDGSTVRVGYVISDKWLTAYVPFEAKA